MHVRSSPRDKSLSQGQQLSKLVALLILSLQRTIFLVVTKSRSMSQRLPIRLLHFIWIVMGRTKRKYFLDELFSFLLLLSCLLVLCCFLLSQWKIALWNSVLLTSEDTGDVNFSFFSLKPADLSHIPRRLVWYISSWAFQLCTLSTGLSDTRKNFSRLCLWCWHSGNAFLQRYLIKAHQKKTISAPPGVFCNCG